MREAATAALAEMDRTGKVGPGYRRMRAAELVEEFPGLAWYMDAGRVKDVLRLGTALCGYAEPERSVRLDALRKTIAAHQRPALPPASSADVGLLHPVVVTADHQLVGGGRRLAAVRSLGWTEVAVTVVDLSTAAEVLRAEAYENTCRKQLTPSEALLAHERRAKVLAPAAAENSAGKGRDRSSKLDDRLKVGAVRKVAANGTGYSGTTLDKVAAVLAVVGAPETPEPVREAATAALGDVAPM